MKLHVKIKKGEDDYDVDIETMSLDELQRIGEAFMPIMAQFLSKNYVKNISP